MNWAPLKSLLWSGRLFSTRRPAEFDPAHLLSGSTLGCLCPSHAVQDDQFMLADKCSCIVLCTHQFPLPNDCIIIHVTCEICSPLTYARCSLPMSCQSTRVPSIYCIKVHEFVFCMQSKVCCKNVVTGSLVCLSEVLHDVHLSVTDVFYTYLVFGTVNVCNVCKITNI